MSSTALETAARSSSNCSTTEIVATATSPSTTARENRSRLDALAEALLRDETLDQPQAYAAAGLAPPPEDDTAPVEAAAPVAT